MATEIKGLVVKIAQRCNLNCSYCYMYQHADQSWRQRPPFMSEETFGHLLTRIEEYCDGRPGREMNLTFHGGEPMLIGPERFDRIVSMAKEKLKDRVSLGMQTNGTLVNDEWIEVLKRHNLRVGVSLDGPPEIHDLARFDHAGRGSYHQTIEGLQKLRENRVFSCVLTVINPGQSGLEIYRHIRSLGVKNMNFLLPDVTHDSRRLFYPDFDATPISDYLIPIFDAWFDEDDPTVMIRLFDAILTGLLGGSTNFEAIGNHCENYLVIDTDGNIQANDALKVCDSGISESGLNVARHGFNDLHLGLPLVNRLVHEGLSLSAQCQACPERDVCGGGAVTTRYAKANGFDNPSVWCADMLALIGHIRARVQPELGEQAFPESVCQEQTDLLIPAAATGSF
ncbi:MAG TPA: radical SAM protein [Pyrinomonadaceae bacterium]|nr:radical SAM protein [Pyrinomonadaceae bacterium]